MKLTPRCEIALEHAANLARECAHPGTTSLHLVFGLLQLNSGFAANLLIRAGATATSLRETIKALTAPDPAAPLPLTVPIVTGHILAASARRALTRAAEEARLCNHTYLGTEHLLLSILSEQQGSTVAFFRNLRADARSMALSILAEYGLEIPKPPKSLLLLEDNEDRSASFQRVLPELGPEWSLQIWRDAPSMLAEYHDHLFSAALISLDHDLNPAPGSTKDPGCGRDISKILSGHEPVAPVLIHSTNADAAWSMHNDLRFARWPVDRIGPLGDDWIQKLWLPKARDLLAANSRVSPFRRLFDHADRFDLALDSLEGLAIADALGEMLSYQHHRAPQIVANQLPPPPWRRTDDSEMALSIAEVLKLYGYIHQDALSRRFAWRFDQDPERGYGKTTRIQLSEINRGADWRKAAAAAFSGQGSMGNGAAMRVAPLGAYFWDNNQRSIDEATQSALVTHTHPEGVAGAVAVAVAAAEAVRLRKEPSPQPAHQILNAAVSDTPKGKVRDGLKLALDLPASTPIDQAAKILGNGSLVTAQDTVPYALWCAAHHISDYAHAVTLAISGGGDCDTNAAIVGGIVAAYLGRQNLPTAWRAAKEPLPPFLC